MSTYDINVPVLLIGNDIYPLTLCHRRSARVCMLIDNIQMTEITCIFPFDPGKDYSSFGAEKTRGLNENREIQCKGGGRKNIHFATDKFHEM